jgi:hypothetical protein
MLDAVVTSIAGGECDKDRGLCLAYSNFSCFRSQNIFSKISIIKQIHIYCTVYTRMLDGCLEPGVGVVR